MNQLIQHIPNFANNGQPKEMWEFETVKDLLDLEYVKDWAEEGKTFCIQDTTLMIVADDNSWWWVIGFLREPVDLPKWSASTGILYE